MSKSEYRLDNYRPAHWRYVVHEGGTRALSDGTTETVITHPNAVWAADTLVSLSVGNPVADVAHQLVAERESKGDPIAEDGAIMSADIPETTDILLTELQTHASGHNRARSIKTMQQGLALFNAWQQAGPTANGL